MGDSILEASIGVEPINQSFADSCLTAWLARHLFYFCTHELVFLTYLSAFLENTFVFSASRYRISVISFSHNSYPSLASSPFILFSLLTLIKEPKEIVSEQSERYFFWKRSNGKMVKITFCKKSDKPCSQL